jgi:PQQ-like domain
VTAEPGVGVTAYPGGIRVRSAWGGSGAGPAVFALSEAGGPLSDHGALAGPRFDAMCRAELRVEAPGGPWTARLASPVYDEPRAVLWDEPGMLVVGYGFRTYGFDARTGDLRWSHRSGTPIVALLGSSRIDHVIVQAELETFALAGDGEVTWRMAHSDVVTNAELVGGNLVLTSYSGSVAALDPRSGRPSS